MKKLTETLSALALAIILFSCNKQGDITAQQDCKTYNIEGEIETVVKYLGCNNVFYSETFNEAGTIECKEGTLQIFKLKYAVQLENNSSISVIFSDDLNARTITPEKSQMIKSTGSYTLLYDSDEVTNQRAVLYIDEEQIESRILTDGTTKFFTPLKGNNIKIAVINSDPVNN
ncbi:MAG: hypothetical protein J0I84_11585 [Terrimonas sp.]|nr:hypothetical protein [Terrimonas sp.]